MKLLDLIDWEGFRPVLEALTGYEMKNWKKGGRPPFDPLLMFKILVLQTPHGLSDEATKAQLKDRLSFMGFQSLLVSGNVHNDH